MQIGVMFLTLYCEGLDIAIAKEIFSWDAF